MAFSQSDLDKLEAAIAQGALSVKYADKQVTYRSLDEMIKIRELMKKSLGQVQSTNSRVYLQTSKGLSGE